MNFSKIKFHIVKPNGSVQDGQANVAVADIELENNEPVEDPFVIMEVYENNALSNTLIFDSETACELAVNLLACAKDMGDTAATKMMDVLLREAKHLVDKGNENLN